MDHFIPKHLQFQVSEIKKKAGVFCCAYNCKNGSVYKLGGLCYKHYQIKVRIKDPVYNRYMNFRGNAKKRPWQGGIGTRLVRYKNKRIFLDELPKDAIGRKMKSLECGIFCDTK